MKAKLLTSLFLFLFLFIYANGQEDLTYEFIFGIELRECQKSGASLTNREDIDKKTDFTIERILSNGDYVIHIIEFSNIDSSEGDNARLVFMDTESSVKRYFLLPKSDFDKNSKVVVKLPKNSFTFGAVTVPIKFRFGSKDDQGNRERFFDFTGDINIGLSAGYKLRPYRNDKFALNFLAGISVTSIEIDEQTTNGFVSTNTKASALTPSLSIVFESQNFQFGIFTGIDFLSGELSDNWVYQNKPWMGIGIGYGIFNKDDKKSPETQKTPN